MADEYVLEMIDIEKRFGGIHALRGFNFNLKAGEVHILMGENGAGKSTLLNILGGIHQANSGEIRINGKPVNITDPIAAREHGVAIIHQELSVCKNMTVAENIYRGTYPTKPPFNFVDYDKMYRDTAALIEATGLNLDPEERVGRLSIAQQQMVEIASAISKNANIVVMDEPTASLTRHEVESLFRIIDTLISENRSIIYVSHRMEETFRIGHRVTVMRDGTYVGTKSTKETTTDELVAMMVGRDIKDAYGIRSFTSTGEKALEVRNFTNEKLKNVSFDLHKGEILGFSGLVGAGRTETARAIFGLDKLHSGTMKIDGKEVVIQNPNDAINHHIGLVPEDRKGAGLILNQSIAFNLTICILKSFIKGINVDTKKELEIVNSYKDILSIKTSGPSQKCRELSGGNQQKVVLSKWMATEPEILILDEPTRGIDVGAKKEIYDLINRLSAQGMAIMFISSDLPEIINLSHRVVVMSEGEIMKIFDAQEEELTQVKIMNYAIGRDDNDN